MPKRLFEDADFVEAARDLAAAGGPASVTVTSVTERLGAPIGSFYHRFASRDVLLANVWLDTALAFQTGFLAAIKARDGLAAAMHTPIWVRDHFNEARALLLYHRDDFAHGNWPQFLKDRVVRQGRLVDAAYKRLARDTFGGVGANELRLARFVVAEVPKAAVSPYLRRGVPPPVIVDDMIETTFRAIVDKFGATGGRQSY
ncbi:AcrR family transcriptional regulator [Bradyrhizobium sp. GM2.4]